jgi:hypothetical protein
MKINGTWRSLARICVVFAFAQGVCLADSMSTAQDVSRAGPILRTQIDAARARRWELRRDALFVYDISHTSVRRVDLPDWSHAREEYSCPPDLILLPSGAVLVTSNVVPNLWEIDPRTLAVHKRRLALDSDADMDVGFTALTFTADGKALVGASSSSGSLWRIDLEAALAYKIALAEPVRDICALLPVSPRETTGGGTLLCVVGGDEGREIELSRDLKSATTHARACER